MMRRIALAYLLLVCCPAFANDHLLVIYNWSDYLPKTVIDQFSETTGITVQYSTYDSNEALYDKIKNTNGQGYDLVVPSTHYVDRLRKEGLLQKINKSWLSNYANLDSLLLNQPHDPDNEYSIPYLWGTTGIAVNAVKIGINRITRWNDLWDPQYESQLLILDDIREVFGVGLKVLGYSINSTNENEIKAAYDKLTEILPNAQIFTSNSPKTPFLQGKVTAGMLWSGEAYVANQENLDIEYIYPQEGVFIWMDSWVIPKGASNVAAAHQFIDFILRPEIGKLISEEIGYASPNEAAVKLLSAEVRNNRIAYPNAEDLQNAEFQASVGEALPIYERYWRQLKKSK